MAKLGDYIEQIRGVSYKPTDLHDSLDEESVTLLRANNIQDGHIVMDEVVYVAKNKVVEKQYLKKGDILICTSSGSKELVGKAAYIEENIPITFGAFCKVIRPKTECPKYIGLFFQSPYYRKSISGLSAGANINNIRNEHIEGLEIHLPPLNEQRRISAVLDKVSDLIVKRREQLDKLDELVKARFVEMFGDPLSNTKNWACLELTKACKAILGGGTPSKNHPEYFMGIIPWVSPKDMKQTVINDSIDHITEDAIANSTTNFIPRNSVLMVIRSGILKHTLPVAINNVPVTINQDMKAFVPDSAISTEFLMYYFKSIEPDVLAGVRGVTADNIDFKTFQKRKIIVPPINLQQQFAIFVKRINKSKLTIRQSLDKLEVLKKALMQQYFG